MELQEFIRKPFVIEAVEITEENIHEVAAFVGDVVTTSDKPFIMADRRLVPNVSRVYIGDWMTKMNGNVRCYPPRLFHEQFHVMTGDIGRWVDFIEKSKVPSG